jgi:predicted XRE-type DNA-binding protein
MESELKQGLLAAYRRLLKPLVRILLRNGVPFGEFAEVAKEAYIDVAARDFKVPNRKMSQARIAILTGLTRKEVARLVGDKGKGKQELRSNHNRVTRVLTGWHTDANYTGPYGLPLELRFEGRNGYFFSNLVQKYSGDMAARAMLDELLRIGAVKETETGWYKVLTRTYMPVVDEMDSLDRLASVIRNFINTIDRNINEPDPEKRLFERHVFADNGIKKKDLPKFRSFIKGRAQLLIAETDNWLSQLDQPNEDDKNIVNTGLGIFHYIETDDDELTDQKK